MCLTFLQSHCGHLGAGIEGTCEIREPRGPSALMADELCEFLENISPPCALLSLRGE